MINHTIMQKKKQQENEKNEVDRELCVHVCVCLFIPKKELQKMSHNVVMEAETASSENVNRSVTSAKFQMFGCTF